MADATVAVTAGRVAALQNLAVIPITVTYSTTAYTTATGGLPFDLFAVLNQAGPYVIDDADIIGLVPFGTSAEKFIVDGSSFAVGTVTSTAVPCTVRIYGTGSGEKAALTEIDNASISGSFEALLLVARGAKG